MKNKNGFTLIELLTVIIILGIVSTVALPQVTKYIEKSKRNAYVTVANSYVDSVTNSITSQDIDPPSAINDVVIINLNMIELDKDNGMSPYNSPWVDSKSYVAVVNEGTKLDPNYAYYFAAQDEDRNAIPLTRISEINEDTVENHARNTMEVTVQSLAGSIGGTVSTKGIISGLENPTDENGRVLDWNVIIYTDQQ